MPQPDTLLFIMLTLVKKTLILDVCIHDFGHVWFFFLQKIHVCICACMLRERGGGKGGRGRTEGGKEGGREGGNFKGCPYDHYTIFQRTMQRHKATNNTCFFILVSYYVKSNNKTQRRRKW